MAITFDIIGSVSLKKAWIALAPSMAAASKGSFGSDRKPASMISTMKGVHCQMSASSTPAMRRRARGQDRILRRAAGRLHRAAAEHAEGAVEHQQEHHGGDGRRHDQRQGHQRAQQAVALAVGIEQEAISRPSDKLDDEGDAGIEERVAERVPDALVARRP